jgi:FAD/FMN-containing dehydrogenase
MTRDASRVPLDRIRAVVGEDDAWSAPDARHASAGGRLPVAVVAPAKTGELQELLAIAEAEGLAIVPEGSGQLLHLGNPASRVDLVVSLRRFGAVLSYEPTELVATVQSGVSLSALAERLSREGQFWPLSPPFAEAQSVGGVVAADASGPDRLGWGTARDLVLGAEAVLPGGDIVRSGGTVVKNVAGYDLLKLMVGSLGTLGILTELSLRLRPMPSCRGLAVFFARSWTEVEDVSAALLTSPLGPTSLDALNRTAAQQATPILEVQGIPLTLDTVAVVAAGFDGTEAEVEHQLAASSELAAGPPDGVAVIRGGGASAVRQRLRDLPLLPATIGLRITVPSSGVAGAAESLEAVAVERGWQPTIQAHMGSGTVHIAVSLGGDVSPQPGELTEACRELRALARAAGGYCVIDVAPPEVKLALDAWAIDGMQAELMRRIKRAFDRRGILSPGRLVRET